MDAAWKIVGFIPVRDGASARTFYEQTIGMQFVSDDGFAIVMSANGTMVRLVRLGMDFNPVPYTICGWEVPEIESAVSMLATRGVVLERYPFADPADGIWTAPDGDRVAWFKDPDGNTLSISQHVGTMDLGL